MIIGLTGRKYSGKDTAAKAFTNYVPSKFAHVLKAMTRTFLSEQGCGPEMVERMVDGDLKEVPSFQYIGGKTPREFQQLIGTEFGRDLLQRNIWVTCAMNRAQQHTDVIFTDVRFPNEVAAVQSSGGYVIRLERDVPLNEFSDHPSEAAIDLLDVDYVVENNGAVYELYDALKEIQENHPNI